jgi:Tetratricopeptide repeat
LTPDLAAAYHHGRGEPRPAVPLATRAHHLYHTLLGEDHPETLASAHCLAWNLGALGEHEQARALAEDTLTHCRRVLGHDHPNTLAMAHTLAKSLGALTALGT